MNKPLVIGTELGDTLWLRGHITNRDQRRRLIESSEWGCELTFLGAVTAARWHEYVWMQPVEPPDDTYSWWDECDQSEPDAEPWTRIEMPVNDPEDRYWK